MSATPVLLPLPVTLFYAGLSAILIVVLALHVVRLRFRAAAEIGDGGDPGLQRAIRAHGNTVEYLPAGLILLALLEAAGAPGWAVHLLGGMLLVGRLVYLYGFLSRVGASAGRSVGVVLTWAALLGAGVYALYLGLALGALF